MVAGTFGSRDKAGTTKMTIISTTAGIDTSKAKLDIAVNGSHICWQVENTPAGWRRLATLFKDHAITRAGIEATGGYEQGVVAHLRDHGITVLLLQPVQVKAFGRVHLRRAKNDRLDAALIAECAAAMDRPRLEPDKRLAELAHQLTFVEQIEEDIVRFKVRLEHINDKRLKRMVVSDLVRLKARRAAQLLRIANELKTHDDLARRLKLVQSVPGIGERTAIELIVRMPELGHVSREEAASLAGLAPFDDDSGKHKGQRHIAGGRGRVRRSLYAAALPAAFRWNTALIAFYKRLMARGKTHKTALTACARKLLVYANTVLQRNQPWVQKTQTA